tara:strand:+ start:4519 stop:5235 length:717 start_codon:yes stop_codon:yes gene_type:complete
MNNNFKKILAIIYLICLGLILYAFFNLVDITELNNYSYIRDKSQVLLNFKNSNLFVFSLTFFLFTIIWILLLGFATPIAIITGYIFGKFYGLVFAILGFSTGCTLLYLLAKFYFKELIQTKLAYKINNIKYLFNKNEFFYFLIFRMAGGGGVPFAIQNLLPVIFDMKVKNYIFATLLGLVPTTFISVALGAGLEKIIQNNTQPGFLDIILSPDIYLPLFGLVVLILISYFLGKKFFEK